MIPNFIHYTCKAELLPVVEGALAANGYTIDFPLQQHVNGITALVMRCGTTTVLLEHLPNSAVDAIEVWGAGQSATADLFETLPIDLHKQPHSRTRRYPPPHFTL